jgi:hypothetical protein
MTAHTEVIQNGCNVRLGDHPTGTPRTDDTELGERIGLNAPVEMLQRQN